MLIVLTINNYNGLILLISMINDNLRTPKIYSLYNLIDWFKFKQIYIPKKLLNDSPLDSNGSLSGFIEAEGQFSVRTTITSKYPK
jgi:hypothetical protein